MNRTFKNIGKRIESKRESAFFCFHRHFFFVSSTHAGENSPIETVLKIKAYKERLTRGYSLSGGSW